MSQLACPHPDGSPSPGLSKVGGPHVVGVWASSLVMANPAGASLPWGLAMEPGSRLAELLGHLSGPGPGPADSLQPPSLLPITVKETEDLGGKKACLRPPSMTEPEFQISWFQVPHSPTHTTAACHMAELAGPPGLGGPTDDATWTDIPWWVPGRQWEEVDDVGGEVATVQS